MLRVASLGLLGVVLAVVALGCSSDGSSDGEAEAVVPSGWEVHDFDGGSVATPADWSPAATLPDGDELMLLGPDDRPEGPMALRIKVTPRDPIPFEELASTAGGTLVLQFGDVERVDDREVSLPGAEQASVTDFRYVEQWEGEDHELHESMLVAWFDGDRQLQLRTGGPVATLDDDEATIEAVLDSVSLEGS